MPEMLSTMSCSRGELRSIGPIIGRVCINEKIVDMNCLKSRNNPYICSPNPSVVKRNHPATIMAKPAKKKREPVTFVLRQKKEAVPWTPTSDTIPISSAN